MTDDRIISGKRKPEDNVDAALRPKSLNEYEGQERVVQNLRIVIEAALKRSEPLDHVLFYGPPGLGKTTLAYVLGTEMGVNVKIAAGPSIERAGDLAAILTHQRKGDILFIDEIHRLGRAVEEILYPAMEDFALDIVIGKGPAAKNVRLNLPRFTVVGATTRLALITAPLRARFGAVYRMDFYSHEAMVSIIKRGAKLLNVPIEDEGANEIARRSRGTPRVGIRLLKRCRDFAQVRGGGIITREIATEFLGNYMEIDELGLDDVDRRVLRTIIEKYDGGPVGLETIAASISEESDTIEDVYEPFLLQLGMIDRTPRGRTATRTAYQHLNIPYTPSPKQTTLFGSE